MIGACGKRFLRTQGGQAKARPCRKHSRRAQCFVRASLNISSHGTAPIESHLYICVPPVNSRARGGPQADVTRAYPCLKGSSLGSDAQVPLGSKIVVAAFSSSHLDSDSRHPCGRALPSSNLCWLYIRCASSRVKLQTQVLPSRGQLLFLQYARLSRSHRARGSPPNDGETRACSTCARDHCSSRGHRRGATAREGRRVNDSFL